ncbi:MAG: 2-amino-4-hydroxy-6-hydroxymethyldihydropteridine diphosphokinase [Planctomycetota bacterium]|nr:MAG: 2-amino-4-hydroxy-6-hydroxymethyldihydropteridine diphosphokinase [Planctomycetota bacterium]
MARCTISFGANIGNAAATVRRAADRLQQELCPDQASHFRLSALYETPPVGGPGGQAPFVNAVAALETSASPHEVWAAIRRIESELGRTRSQRWEARKIDLDILMYEDVRIWTPQLKIPHPRMCMRRFMLIPAREVAADMRDPVSGLTIQELVQRLEERGPGIYLHARDPRSARSIARRLAHRDASQSPGTEASGAGGGIFVGGSGGWIHPVSTSPVWSAPSVPSSPLGNDTATPPPFLHVVLCGEEAGQGTSPDRSTADPRSAVWETRCLDMARCLHLCPNGPGQDVLAGEPRYLLPADTLDWTLHELRAALDAMTCPLSRL